MEPACPHGYYSYLEPHLHSSIHTLPQSHTSTQTASLDTDYKPGAEMHRMTPLNKEQQWSLLEKL